MTKTMRWLSRTALVAALVGGAACDDAISLESLADTLTIDQMMDGYHPGGPHVERALPLRVRAGG